MCFSATASFTAAAALSGIGVLSIRSAPTRRHLPLAAIPLIFAVQQLVEGALWLELERTPFGKSDTPIGRFFLFFALFLWPAYVPLALAVVESKRLRRVILYAVFVLGFIIGTYLFACATLRRSDTCIAFANLYYWVQIDAPVKPLVTYAYVATIIVGLVVSSRRGTTALAIFAGASFAAVGMLNRAGFVSVWCYVMALASGVIVAGLRIEKRGELARIFKSWFVDFDPPPPA